jgi:hypothetical protein
MKELCLVMVSGALAFQKPFSPEILWEHMRDEKVDIILADAGSADCGPLFLATGQPYASWTVLEQDIRNMLKASREKDIPMIIGSAIGGGSSATVDSTAERIKRIAKEEKL